MRSRRCKDEGASIMPLDLVWEGEANYESEPEELPENLPRNDAKDVGAEKQDSSVYFNPLRLMRRGVFIFYN